MSVRKLITSLRGGQILLPALRRHLLKEQDAIAQGKLTHKDQVKADAAMTIDCFKERYDTYNHGERDTGYFHPSQLGTCMRALWYGHKGAPKNKRPGNGDLVRTSLIFEFGTYIGVLFQNLCESAGVLVKREELVRSKAERTEGHADGRLRIDNEDYLLEIKTINSRQFRELKGTLKDGHKKQMMSYMKVLKLKWGIIVYINKDTCELLEFVIQFDEFYYDQNCRNRIDKWFRIKDRNTPPDREGSNPSRMPCSFCDFNRVCYDSQLSALFLKSLRNETQYKDKIKAGKSIRLRIKRKVSVGA